MQHYATLPHDRLGNPILNLNYLLETIMQKVRPLDWGVFWEKQATNKLPLKVMHVSVFVLCDIIWATSQIRLTNNNSRFTSCSFETYLLVNPVLSQIVASGLLSQESVVLSAQDGNFASMEQLALCLRASMMIPGVAGDVVRLKVLTFGVLTCCLEEKTSSF